MIIMYHPTLKLGYDGSVETEESRADIDKFAEICKENNIEFLDMTNRFYETYKSEHILPHGFCNTQVEYGHLNSNGHKMIADEIYMKIQELENSI